jgi:hypothetical protein
LIRVTRMVERASTTPMNIPAKVFYELSMNHELSTNSARLSVSKSPRFQRQNCS